MGHMEEERREVHGGVGNGTGRQESLGERGGPELLWIGAAGMAGPTAQEGDNIYKKIYVSWVCVSVQAVLQGEVGETDRGWYKRSVSECTTSGTVGMGGWNPPCKECTRPT